MLCKHFLLCCSEEYMRLFCLQRQSTFLQCDFITLRKVVLHPLHRFSGHFCRFSDLRGGCVSFIEQCKRFLQSPMYQFGSLQKGLVPTRLLSHGFCHPEGIKCLPLSISKNWNCFSVGKSELIAENVIALSHSTLWPY